MIILQISPEFSPGTGVGSVAYNLERQWLARGHDVRRFGPAEAGAAWLDGSGAGLKGRVRHMARVVWFSTVGTVRARRVVNELPKGAVSICHNDALAGDIYINHGVLQSAMRARGGYRWRMVRNPLHLFTAARDRIRYGGTTHRLVINLTQEDDRALRATYPRLKPATQVVGNGVDVAQFRPPSPRERRDLRARLRLAGDTLVTVFIGNEYERKGLYPLVDAIAQAGERHHLLVVGGTTDMTAHLAAVVVDRGIEDRCHILGKQDPLPYLWAADLLAQPSAYESYGLVVTEALAAGVPVLSTPVGVALDVIQHGVNGYLTDGTPTDIVTALRSIELADREAMRDAARQAALDHTWEKVAAAYLAIFEQLTSVRMT